MLSSSGFLQRTSRFCFASLSPAINLSARTWTAASSWNGEKLCAKLVQHDKPQDALSEFYTAPSRDGQRLMLPEERRRASDPFNEVLDAPEGEREGLSTLRAENVALPSEVARL